MRHAAKCHAYSRSVKHAELKWLVFRQFSFRRQTRVEFGIAFRDELGNIEP